MNSERQGELRITSETDIVTARKAVREAATTLRELALLAREAAARADAGARTRAATRLRKVNERLVLAAVDAQVRTEAAEQVTAAMAQAARHDYLTGLPNRSLLAERLRSLGADVERLPASALPKGFAED